MMMRFVQLSDAAKVIKLPLLTVKISNIGYIDQILSGMADW
jgi:hypothetical protein